MALEPAVVRTLRFRGHSHVRTLCSAAFVVVDTTFAPEQLVSRDFLVVVDTVEDLIGGKGIVEVHDHRIPHMSHVRARDPAQDYLVYIEDGTSLVYIT